MNVRNQRYTKSYPPDKHVSCQALQGIKEIKPFFHKVVFWSRLRYSDFDLMFQSRLKQPNNSKNIANALTDEMYNNVAWVRLPKTKKHLTIFHCPSKPYYPASRIKITSPSIEDLIELELITSSGSSKSEVFLSSIEYTIDFMCYTPTDVGNLFYMLRRNFYCPHAKETFMTGGTYMGYSHSQDYSSDREQNVVFSVNFSKNRKKGNKRLKIYERGPDNAKERSNKYWKHYNCDRVRFEVVFYQKILKDYNIQEICHFLTRPKFYELIFPSDKGQHLFQFKSFKKRDYRHHIPPNRDQDYFRHGMDPLEMECFLEEVFYAKFKDMDISNNLQPYDRFDKLVYLTQKAVRKFEKNWIKTGTAALAANGIYELIEL